MIFIISSRGFSSQIQLCNFSMEEDPVFFSIGSEEFMQKYVKHRTPAVGVIANHLIDISNLNADIAELRSSLEKIREEQEQLPDPVASLQDRMNEIFSSSSALEARVESLGRDTSACMAAIRVLEEDNAALRSSNEDLKSTVFELKQSNHDLRELVVKVVEANVSIRNQLDEVLSRLTDGQRVVEKGSTQKRLPTPPQGDRTEGVMLDSSSLSDSFITPSPMPPSLVDTLSDEASLPSALLTSSPTISPQLGLLPTPQPLPASLDSLISSTFSTFQQPSRSHDNHQHGLSGISAISGISPASEVRRIRSEDGRLRSQSGELVDMWGDFTKVDGKQVSWGRQTVLKQNANPFREMVDLSRSLESTLADPRILTDSRSGSSASAAAARMQAIRVEAVERSKILHFPHVMSLSLVWNPFDKTMCFTGSKSYHYAVSDVPLPRDRPTSWNVTVERLPAARWMFVGIIGTTTDIPVHSFNHPSSFGWGGCNQIYHKGCISHRNEGWGGWNQGDVGVYTYNPMAGTLTLFLMRTNRSWVIECGFMPVAYLHVNLLYNSTLLRFNA